MKKLTQDTRKAFADALLSVDHPDNDYGHGCEHYAGEIAHDLINNKLDDSLVTLYGVPAILREAFESREQFISPEQDAILEQLITWCEDNEKSLF